MIRLCFHLLSQDDARIAFSGIALRAAFLEMVRNQNEPLGAWFHSGEGTRPYSILPLEFDRRFGTTLEAGEEYLFEVVLFDTTGLNEVIRDLVVAERDSVRLYKYELPVLQVEVRQIDPTIQMQKWIQDTADTTVIHMSFLTPTQLSHFGTDRAYLFPSPDKVFSSLMRVWNTMESDFRSKHISEYRTWIERNVYVSRHKVRTYQLRFGQSRSLLGFLGDVTFSLEERRGEMADFTKGLAQFAELCNVGKNRTAGLGLVRATFG